MPEKCIPRIIALKNDRRKEKERMAKGAKEGPS